MFVLLLGQVIAIALTSLLIPFLFDLLLVFELVKVTFWLFFVLIGRAIATSQHVSIFLHFNN